MGRYAWRGLARANLEAEPSRLRLRSRWIVPETVNEWFHGAVDNNLPALGPHPFALDDGAVIGRRAPVVSAGKCSRTQASR